MEQRELAGPEPLGAGQVPHVVQASGSPRRVQPGEPVQRWEVQWQEVVPPLQPPAQAGAATGTPELPDLAPGDSTDVPETWRRRFRDFRYQGAAGPREVCSRLQELCQRWLDPQRRSKEQMLELVVLEQFLAVLPREMRSWEWGRGVETCAEAVALAEGVQLGQAEEEKLQVTVHVKVEGEASDKMAPARALWEPPDSCLELLQPHPRHVPLEEEAGEGESPGLLNEPPRILKEEPPPHEDSDSADTEDTWDSSEDETWLPKRGLSSDAGSRTWRKAEPRKDGPGAPEQLRTSLGKPSPRPERGQLLLLHALPLAPSGTVSKVLAPPWPENGERTELQPCQGQKETVTELGKLPRQEGQCPNPGGGEGFGEKQEPATATWRERSWPGLVCGKFLDRQTRLALRARAHAGDKPNSCADCGKSFGSPSNLAAHHQVHSKAPQCARCGKSFSKRSALARYQHIHSGEKPHWCASCEKSFARPDKLESHRSGQLSPKRHRCTECGMDFARGQDLARHQRSHTRKSLSCPGLAPSGPLPHSGEAISEYPV